MFPFFPISSLWHFCNETSLLQYSIDFDLLFIFLSEKSVNLLVGLYLGQRVFKLICFPFFV